MTLTQAIERAKRLLEERISRTEEDVSYHQSCGSERRVAALKVILERDTEALQALREWKPEENAEKYERLSKAYNELIMAVQRKFPGEIRHDTALRYINEAESNECCGPSREPDSAPAGEGREE